MQAFLVRGLVYTVMRWDRTLHVHQRARKQMENDTFFKTDIGPECGGRLFEIQGSAAQRACGQGSFVAAAASLRFTWSAQSGLNSRAAIRRFRRSAATGMDPLPAKGSSTMSSGLVHVRMRGSKTENGL